MTEHWNGGSGGKGDKPRPYAVTKGEFDESHTRIFGEKQKYCKTCGKTFSWCQCNTDTDDKITRYNEETQQVLGVTSYTKEI